MAATSSVLSREAGSPAPAPRSARRRPSTSHILIGLAAVLAFGLNYLALQNRDSVTLVAVADVPIAEGTQITTDLLRFAPLPSDFEGIGHLVTEADLALLDGWIVSRSLAEGELVDRATVIEPGAGGGLRTMSIPIPVEHAAGGTLVLGDRVDVISVIGDEPRFVAADLEVVAIAETGQGGLAGVGAYHIVVAVTADEALAVARAIDDGSMELVRSTGSGALPGDEG